MCAGPSIASSSSRRSSPGASVRCWQSAGPPSMYEPRLAPPLSRRLFSRRFLLHFAAAQLLKRVSHAIGMGGYMYFEQLPWREAFMNTARQLDGMGPIDPLKTDGGKVFAGLFALYAGLLFLVVAATLLAPVVHRILHRFHWEQTRK